MVALDEQNKPVQVPRLKLHKQTEIRRFLQALQGKELKKHYKQEEVQMKLTPTKEGYLNLLKMNVVSLVLNHNSNYVNWFYSFS